MDSQYDDFERKLQEDIIRTNAIKPIPYLNRPDTFTITSRNATIDGVLNSEVQNNSFYRFTATLPKSILEPKGCQLAGINFPQANGTSFHDSELVFYYYKLKTQKSFNPTERYTIYTESPSSETMRIVRLLPSYYKQELIPDAQIFGFNKTFNNYQELSDELKKACINDLAVRNGSTTMPFESGDVTIEYNQQLNKFQMTGNNTATAWIPPNWSEGVTYSQNNIILWEEGIYYISIINDNINYDPPSTPLAWELYTEPFTYSYLIAGFNDPNIPIVSQVVTDNSQLFDYLNAIYGSQKVLAIPPQPLTANGLTLNKRLGYTWNGEFPGFRNEVFLSRIQMKTILLYSIIDSVHFQSIYLLSLR